MLVLSKWEKLGAILSFVCKVQGLLEFAFFWKKVLSVFINYYKLEFEFRKVGNQSLNEKK